MVRNPLPSLSQYWRAIRRTFACRRKSQNLAAHSSLGRIASPAQGQMLQEAFPSDRFSTNTNLDQYVGR